MNFTVGKLSAAKVEDRGCFLVSVRPGSTKKRCKPFKKLAYFDTNEILAGKDQKKLA